MIKPAKRWGMVLLGSLILVSVMGHLIGVVIATLEGKDIWAGFMGNFTSGLLTVFAGMFVIVQYFIQERQANVGRLIEWMSDLAKRYHEDPEFREVRLKLATDRDMVQRQIALETALDSDATKLLAQPEFDGFARPAEVTRNQVDWAFLRQLTDYIYFFEQLLAYGELLRESAPHVATALVDHFGWFLRALHNCCVDDHRDPRHSLQARKFFVVYLATNRYRRLAEVGLFFIAGETGVERAEITDFAERVCAVLQGHRGGVAAGDLAEIERRWGKLLYTPAATKL